MKLLEETISFLQFTMEEPKMYGWFHLLCLVLMILLTLFLIKKCNNHKKVLLILSTIMIGLEIYKQLSFSFNNGTWKYQWYAFPFQFCSTPMYIAFIAGLTKNKKLKKSFYSFLATYGLIAGISVMLYPNTVFIEETLINIQTMIHHGFMIVMGLYLILTNKVKCNYKTILNGLKVFITLIFIATIGNIITYYLHIDNGLELFYISPFHTSSLPIFNIIYDKIPYLLFLIIYISSFTIGSYLPLVIIKLFKKIKEYNKKNLHNHSGS